MPDRVVCKGGLPPDNDWVLAVYIVFCGGEQVCVLKKLYLCLVVLCVRQC